METALEISNLVKKYNQNFTALNGVSLQVAQGDFFALLGPNGAGKSTIIGILCGLVNKTSGQINILGYDLDTQNLMAKRSIGVVPQEFNFSIFEKVKNIIKNQAGYYGVPRRVAQERTDFFLKEVGLWDKRNEIAQRLSGGMKRRLMIARALVHNPKLLILDEPTAGVDIEIRRSMWGFLRKINKQGTTIILTTHYLEEAENLCNHIAIIDQGKIIENTSKRKLLQQLNTSSYILELAAPIDFKPALKGFRFEMTDTSTCEVEVAVDRTINEVFDYLSSKNVKVASMRNKSNRLEELFLALTSNQ